MSDRPPDDDRWPAGDGWSDGEDRGRGELPPDPFGAPPPPPPPPAPPPPIGPRRDRGVWHHPAVWVVLLILAGVLLLTALLESPAPAPREPSPDAVEARAAP